MTRHVDGDGTKSRPPRVGLAIISPRLHVHHHFSNDGRRCATPLEEEERGRRVALVGDPFRVRLCIGRFRTAERVTRVNAGNKGWWSSECNVETRHVYGLDLV